MKISSFYSIFVAHDLQAALAGYAELGFKQKHALDVGPFTLNVLEAPSKERIDLIEMADKPEGFLAQRMNVSDLEEAVRFLQSRNFTFIEESLCASLASSYRVNQHIIYLTSCKMAYMKSPDSIPFLLIEHI